MKRIGKSIEREDIDDVRVADLVDGAGLLDEPVAKLLVVRQVAVHDFEGDLALEAEVGGEVDGRHATTRNPRTHLVSAVEETTDQLVR